MASATAVMLMRIILPCCCRIYVPAGSFRIIHIGYFANVFGGCLSPDELRLETLPERRQEPEYAAQQVSGRGMAGDPRLDHIAPKWYPALQTNPIIRSDYFGDFYGLAAGHPADRPPCRPAAAPPAVLSSGSYIFTTHGTEDEFPEVMHQTV